jgi:pimeloyl-ACP methyl ester carboxylesterase
MVIILSGVIVPGLHQPSRRRYLPLRMQHSSSRMRPSAGKTHRSRIVRMRYIRSRIFAAAGDRDQPLLIHTRLPEGANSTLILLVHGWGGERYNTWGDLPRYLFEEFTDADIGLFDYLSGWRRLSGRGSTRIAATVRELADLIRETAHENVLLLGHSMGGILAMAAIKELIDTNARDGRHGLTVERIRGLFLLATPQAGSAWARLFAPTRDGRVLRPGSSFTREIQERFSDHVQVWGTSREPDRFLIPTRALIASRDRIVTSTSARLHLPSRNTFTDRAEHRSLVKPVSPDSSGYQWLVVNIRSLLWPEQTLHIPRDMIVAATADFERERKASRPAQAPPPRRVTNEPVNPWHSGDDTFAYLFQANWRYTHEAPSHRATPYAVLYVPFGTSRGQSYALDRPETTIGRSPGSDIVLGDPTVSGRHAAIVRDGATYRIRDLGSTNGTFVDHKSIARETDLTPGCVIQVGRHRFLFLGASF